MKNLKRINASEEKEIMELLLDGSKMKESKFYKKFKEIVGVTWEKWTDRDNVEKDSGAEWYCDQDENFVYSGSAYDPPKLFRKHAPKSTKEANEQKSF